MEKLFKSITIIAGEIFVEMNRELTLEDFLMVGESNIENIENGNGRIIRKLARYKMNQQTLVELTEYSSKLISIDKYNDENGKHWLGNLMEFSIISRKDVDFRGCRNEESRTEKINSAMEEVVADHKHQTETVLPSNILATNIRLAKTVEFYNNAFSEKLTGWLTNDEIYIESFSDNALVQALEKQYKQVHAKLIELRTERYKTAKALAEIKRKIALDVLKADNWTIDDGNSKTIVIPQPVVKSVEDAMKHAFVKKDGMLIN